MTLKERIDDYNFGDILFNFAGFLIPTFGLPWVGLILAYELQVRKETDFLPDLVFVFAGFVLRAELMDAGYA